MIVVDGNNIRISRGDTLDISFEVEGYEIKPTDKITFTVKENLSKEAFLIQKDIDMVEGNTINVVLSKEEMEAIPVGVSYYDLVCISEDKRVTFNFPYKLIVERIVHNV